MDPPVGSTRSLRLNVMNRVERRGVMFKGILFYGLALVLAWCTQPTQAGWGDLVGQQILNGAAQAVGKAVGDAVSGDGEESGAPVGQADGGQSVDGVAGRSYAASAMQGGVTLEQLVSMPDRFDPLAVTLKADKPAALRAKPRIAVPSYAVSFIQSGDVRGYAAGQGATLAQRSVSIKVALAGMSDADYRRLADEAYADLLQRLHAVGIAALDHAQMATLPDYAAVERVPGNRIADEGYITGRAEQQWTVYGASDAPLVKGMAMETGFAAVAGSQAVLQLVDVGVDLDAVIVQPLLVIDFAHMDSSGSSMFTGRASANAQLAFGLHPRSKVDVNYAERKGRGNLWGVLTLDRGVYSDEPFAVLHKVGANDADQSFYQAAMAAGWGSMFKQSEVYAAQVAKARYMGLVRAAYAGFNSALVTQILQARQVAGLASGDAARVAGLEDR